MALLLLKYIFLNDKSWTAPPSPGASYKYEFSVAIYVHSHSKVGMPDLAYKKYRTPHYIWISNRQHIVVSVSMSSAMFILGHIWQPCFSNSCIADGLDGKACAIRAFRLQAAEYPHRGAWARSRHYYPRTKSWRRGRVCGGLSPCLVCHVLGHPFHRPLGFPLAINSSSVTSPHRTSHGKNGYDCPGKPPL